MVAQTLGMPKASLTNWVRAEAKGQLGLMADGKPAPVPSIQVKRLDAHHLLASADCWLAAYNAGTGYWVVDDSPPYRATLVTDSASDDDGAVITSVHKGRGVGDCYGCAP